MSAIASKRIKKEFLEMPKSDEPNRLFYLEPVDNNLLDLKGYILGPTETPFEGGVFNVEVKIPETYPFNPPKVKFTTRIWHPNISSVTGAICLDILKDQWAAAMTLRTVLLSIQALLSSAEPDDPQDAVVARQYKDNPEVYRATARFWTYFFAMPAAHKIEVEKKKQFACYEERINKLVDVMSTTRVDALVALSHHDWNLDVATQNFI